MMMIIRMIRRRLWSWINVRSLRAKCDWKKVTVIVLVSLGMAYVWFTSSLQPSPDVDPELFAEYQHERHAIRNMIDESDTNNINYDKPWYMQDGVLWPNDYTTDWQDQTMFPEDAPYDDRIANQLMYIIPEDNRTIATKNILLKVALQTHNQWLVDTGFSEFVECPTDRCVLTLNSAEAAIADAIIFSDVDTIYDYVRPDYQIWIFFSTQHPDASKALHLPLDAFNWTATYRRDSDIVVPTKNWQYYHPGVRQNGLNKDVAKLKQRKVAWIVTNCNTTSDRHLMYAIELSKYIQVDTYGKCPGYAQCPKTDPKCLSILSKHYKFVIAFEESSCIDYITEKFFDALEHVVVPIVMGARPADYDAVAPEKSYIHVEDFKDASDLAKYLVFLDEEDKFYNEYFMWHGTGEFINTHFFCRLCAMIHANDVRQRRAHYTDIQAWWTKDVCNNKDWRKNSQNYVSLSFNNKVTAYNP